ncbi:MAG: MraY family glycosyltransferase [Gammaproteobacteria bacterium]|jgi:UDP-GlcNAc:undecaprenyl-phosphate/decaprenyl-phosphate GlcNAc-1-phosphate transferase|nr:MraY family glycosyltransferase [Gammaproteobacteria bacterium]
MDIFSLFSSFCVTGASLFALKPMANKVGLMDHPGGRKTHAHPTPLIGGIGIYLGVLFISLFNPTVLNEYGDLLAISTIVLVLGAIDDYKHMPISIRMSGQALAATLMYFAAGNQLTSFGNLFGFGEISLGTLSFPITVFATVGVINAINMNDGLDGLSGGMVAIALSLLSVVAWQAGNTSLLTFIAILLSALLAFLALNFRLPWKKTAIVYLGDSGSTFLGFVLAWLFIEATQGENAIMPPISALWFLALPLMDAILLLIKRPLEGKSPFHPGRDHLHHRLLDMGFSNKRVVLSLYLTGVVIGLIGLALHQEMLLERLAFFIFLGLFIFYLLINSFIYVSRDKKSHNS